MPICRGAAKYTKILAGAAGRAVRGWRHSRPRERRRLAPKDDIDDAALEILGGCNFGGTVTGLSITLSGTGQFSGSVVAHGGNGTLNYPL